MQAFWKTDVIEDDARSRSLRLQIKARNGICAFGPGHNAPGLNDALIRNELEIAADDVTLESENAPPTSRLISAGLPESSVNFLLSSSASYSCWGLALNSIS